MDPFQFFLLIALVALVVIFLFSAVRFIRQQRVAVVERLGKYHRTLDPGPHLVVPLVDKLRYNLDMRESVVPFPPQGVITEDNLMVSIDSVIYFQVIDPVRAAYEAQDYIKAIEQLTQTTLRNIIGGLDLEQTLTSREEINQKLRLVLDEATGKWGIKVNRVELRAIDPPPTIRDAMEKGARAERDKRAQILLAEGQRQSQILAASGDRESSILRAQGDREAQVLRAQADRQSQMLHAEGEAQAITTVFGAIHAGKPDQSLLAYQYMQMLPSIAQGDANKVWVVPSELNKALEGLGSAVGQAASSIPQQTDRTEFTAPPKVDVQQEIQDQKIADEDASQEAVKEAIAVAQQLENPGLGKAGRSLGGQRSVTSGDPSAVPGVGPSEVAPQHAQSSESPSSKQPPSSGRSPQPGTAADPGAPPNPQDEDEPPR
ncbi:MAG: SPFH domain-containing protein [Propionibacteriaceae bacterium]